MSEEGKQEQSVESLRAEVAELKAHMEALRAQTEAEVLAKWTSPWKGADTVKAKVDARLATNREFREIMLKAREAEALQADIDPDYVDPSAGRTQGGHPAVR